MRDFVNMKKFANDEQREYYIKRRSDDRSERNHFIMVVVACHVTVLTGLALVWFLLL